VANNRYQTSIHNVYNRSCWILDTKVFPHPDSHRGNPVLITGATRTSMKTQSV